MTDVWIAKEGHIEKEAHGNCKTVILRTRQFSCLTLSNVEITGVGHHGWFRGTGSCLGPHGAGLWASVYTEHPEQQELYHSLQEQQMRLLLLP